MSSPKTRSPKNISIPKPKQRLHDGAQEQLARQKSSNKYNMLSHLKKILDLLIIYDALQMSLELRESLIEVVTNPLEYQD